MLRGVNRIVTDINGEFFYGLAHNPRGPIPQSLRTLYFEHGMLFVSCQNVFVLIKTFFTQIILDTKN